MSAISKADDLAEKIAAYYRHPGRSDPTPLYPNVRERGPVYHDRLGFGIIARHADAVTALQSRNALRSPPPNAAPGSAMDVLTRYFLTMVGPPDHGRLRGLVQKAFTPRAVNRLAEDMQRVTHEYVSRARDRGRMDAVTDLAQPLPISVFSELLDVPVEARPEFTAWMSAILDGLTPAATAAVVASAETAAQSFMDYMGSAVAERRTNPGPDFLSALVHARDAGERLTEHELLSVACHIFLAGMETTAGLVSNGLLALLEHPDQLRLLRSDPALIDSAVEECLRYVGPVRALPLRRAMEDIQLEGGAIPRGAQFTVWLAAANRDPEVFDDPERFDITRTPNPHLGFTTGIHFCLGAHLARLEGRIALGAMVWAFPELALATSTPSYQSSSVLHRLESLPVMCQ